MRTRGLKIRLVTIVAVGLAVGALGLLEPLIGSWGAFHLLGIGVPTLLLLYLSGGLVLSLLAGVVVTLGYAARSSRWLPTNALAHHATAALALTAAIVLAPPVHHELRDFGLPASYALVAPVLLILAALITVKIIPRIMTPFFSWFLGEPSGRVSGARVAIVLIVIGLIVPLTVLQGVQSRNRARGRAARLELRTRPGGQDVQNVLLITVAALRADRLGAYGYRHPTSPRLDSLAARATLFERCFAQGSTTELSLGALFTSLYPSMHGVRRPQHLANPLAPEIETLAENLRDAGLRSTGLMSDRYLKREWGLTQGFDRADEFQYGYLHLLPVRLLKVLHWITPPARIGNLQVPTATAVTDRALSELGRSQGEPFFLFVHYMDVHHPCLPPASHEGLFRTPGASTLEAAALWKRYGPLFKELPSEKEIVAPADLRRFSDLYDGCVRYVDGEIGRLLDGLRARGLDRNTLVVVAADHGTEFMEHGNMLDQSAFLYDELTHVPLIIHWPGQAEGRKLDSQVQLIDVMPTLLAVCDLPRYPGAQGRSLLPLLLGERDGSETPVFNQSYACVAVRTPTRKLMLDLPNNRAYGFRLDLDPREKENVAGQDAGCDSLETLLEGFMRRAMFLPTGVEPTEPDADARTAALDRVRFDGTRHPPGSPRTTG
jgi:arylsulfatase